MGIINLTPDSFSGDGLGDSSELALEQALRFEEAGVDILDIGAESSRPGSTPVDVDEELRRLLPALNLIAGRVRIPISIDTYKSAVAKISLTAGASMINDIWGLKYDVRIAHVAAEYDAPLILMHNQRDAVYKDLIRDVASSLETSVVLALEAGVPKENIILDPGFGFGKSVSHNLVIVQRLSEFKSLGYPLLIGPSRKSTIGSVLDLPANQRIEGTAATIAIAINNGADIVRVHDVPEMMRVLQMSDAITRGWYPLTRDCDD